jgi:amidase
MLGETVNNLFGQTDNPYNVSFCYSTPSFQRRADFHVISQRGITCGGSSGGEGALMALRGSLLGVGSDVAGSGLACFP